MFYQRKHIRLRDFDYSSPNAYFITVCVRYVEPLWGVIKNGICGLVTTWCNENNICFKWQPRFHDHVIRDEKEYWAIKNYIINNPKNWDRFHL